MGGKSQPAPDYGPMRELGEKQLAFAERQYAELKPLAERVAASQIAAQEEQMRQAREYYDYQTGTFRPVEQGLVRQAQAFDTEAYREQLASQAAADTARAFGTAEGVTARNLARRGVGPGSGNAMAMQNQNALTLASARAGAATGARERAEQTGFARKLDVVGLGRNLPGASTAAYQSATGAGSAGVTTSMAPGTQLMTGMQQAGVTRGNVLSNQTSYANANRDQGIDVGGLLTGAAKAYTAFSDRRLKQNIELVGRDERTMLPLYEFEYINGSGRRFLGVMAQDVLETYPDMVFTMPDGFMAVNYAGLGMEMVEVDHAA